MIYCIINMKRVCPQLTLKTFKGFKELCEGLSGELFMVLGGHLDTDLQILTDVCRQHRPQTLEGVLY